jgi:hypothetical protein
MQDSFVPDYVFVFKCENHQTSTCHYFLICFRATPHYWGYTPHIGDSCLESGLLFNKRLGLILCSMATAVPAVFRYTLYLLFKLQQYLSCPKCDKRDAGTCCSRFRRLPNISNMLLFMGRLPRYGQTSQRWEDFPHKASLPIDGKSSQSLGSLPIHGKSCHTWEDFPYMTSQYTDQTIDTLGL